MSRLPARNQGIAPKQNWFGSADGIFVRLNEVTFFFTDGMTRNKGLLLSPFPWAPTKPDTNGNQYWASYNVYLPLNQRLELLVVAPFIASNTTSPTGHYVGNFGDLTIYRAVPADRAQELQPAGAVNGTDADRPDRERE